MNRFDQLMSALQAEYAGGGTWFTRAGDAFRHDNWDRIVAYPSEGSIRNPGMAAQGIRLDLLTGPSAAGAVDDIVWERHTTVTLGIWAGSYEQAENRLHALLAAIAKIVGTSDLEIADLRERWIQAESQDVTSGGALVVLSFVATFYVLASDVTVLKTEIDTGTAGDIGTGQETETVDEFTIEVSHENDDGSTEPIYTIVTPEET